MPRLISRLGMIPLLIPTLSQGEITVAQTTSHQGFPDGSAGVAAGELHFIGACDEDNSLRLFRNDGQGEAKVLLDLNPLLGFTPKKDKSYRECDLEGAARQGDVIYWIGSHGTNREGEQKIERQVILAVRQEGCGGTTTLKLHGKPYKGLAEELTKLHPVLKQSFGGKPEEGGMNIEGICMQDGKLLIGFRSPVPPEGAMVVALTNPAAVIENGEAAAFDAPFHLDMEGHGIRDIASWKGQYLILAGPSKDQGPASCLYVWSGKYGAKPRKLHTFADLNPEAIIVSETEQTCEVRILSDDGGEKFSSVLLSMPAE